MPTSFALPGSIVSGKTSSGTAWSRCGNGPTIVLLHGVGMNKSVWAPEVNLLCESFDVFGVSAIPDAISMPSIFSTCRAPDELQF